MHLKRRYHRVLLTVLITLLSLTLTAGVSAAAFPGVIPLPNGFQPEGITTGRGSTFYAGSIPTGAIYRGDYRTGAGEVLVPPQAGHMSIGLKFDSRSGLLFVAGGPTGMAFIYDGETGANIAAIELTTEASFVNDVVVTEQAAYFTDSFRPVLYKVPLEKNGRLPNPAASEEISLSGDYVFIAGGFNANGIDATDNGKTLVIVNSTTGTLYTVNPGTGEASQIDLGSDSVPSGDGILLHGKTLYVVQNFFNQIAVVQLDSDYTSGAIVDTITSPDFRIPTTIARFGSSLYAVNARFDITPTADTEYEVVQVAR